ncbi:MAG: hypothetical protein PHW52_04675, partial [Candidatus Pacebacteria bacterium]|nr:hypothetical protein [Candidatus Paceibacterota bacterium]
TAGGGGSGGGSINIFYQNTYTNSGSLIANGGASGAGNGGYAGETGTVRNPQFNPEQLPIISANVPYNVTEQVASVDVTITNDHSKGNSTILLEWGNDMIGNYTYSTSLINKGTGTYTMTMDKLDTLSLSKTYYRITVINSEGGSSPIIGNYQVQKSLLTGVRSLNGTGNGDKSITTAYATIPVEYVQLDSSTHYTTNTNLGNATADSSMLAVRYNGDVLIDAGVTLTPAARKRGMFMYVDGALTVNGTISMTARGAANVAGDRILIMTDGGTSYEIPAVGGASNTAGVNGATGGGGSSSYGPAGGSGTSYSGGSGAGGGTGSGSGSSSGGTGGAGRTGCTGCAGGAGNPGGINGGTSASPGSDGTGGLLVIYAKTVVVGSTGSIQANGAKGGDGTAGGGGSGGGSINIFYQNTYTNSGSLIANGGASGAGNGGYAGKSGTVRSVKVLN